MFRSWLSGASEVFRVVLMIAVYNQGKSPRSMKIWSMELGWGPGGSGMRFCCACHAFWRSRGPASLQSRATGTFWP